VGGKSLGASCQGFFCAQGFFVRKAFFARSRQWLAREHIARDTKKPRGQNPRGLVICSAAAC
jgi:hypothetical protein